MLFRRKLCLIVVTGLFIAAGRPTAWPQTAPVAQAADAAKPDLPVEQWLEQGERTEIPWKVSLSKPQVTYRFVNAVNITAELKGNALERPGIQFMVAVAHENGSWRNAESYSSSRIEPKGHGKPTMRATICLKPGAYTIATMLYDAASGKRNLSFHRVQVKDPQKPGLSELLRGVPDIRFVGSSRHPDPPGDEHTLLPVRTEHGVTFDLMVDLSTREQGGDRLELVPPGSEAGRAELPTQDPDIQHWPPMARGPRTRRRPDTAVEQTSEQAKLQEVARALANLDFQPGCTRVSVIDALRLRTLLPPTPVGEVDWRQLGNENSVPDKVVVSVTSLEGRKKADVFFEEQVRELMAQPPSCKLNSGEPLHVIAILSHGIHFPSGSRKPRIGAGCSHCRVFYFYKSGEDITGGDDLKKMLEPLAPSILEFGDPEKFRERVLQFTEAVKKTE
jgi:hypothetical protein